MTNPTANLPPPWDWKSMELEPDSIGTFDFTSNVDQVLELVEVQSTDGQLLELTVGVRVLFGMGLRVFGFLPSPVLPVGVVLHALVRNNSRGKSLIAVKVHAKPARGEDQAHVGEWPKCDQRHCDSPSFASFVWPGQGRVHACLEHFQKMVTVAGALEMDGKALDVKLTARDPRFT